MLLFVALFALSALFATLICQLMFKSPSWVHAALVAVDASPRDHRKGRKSLTCFHP